MIFLPITQRQLRRSRPDRPRYAIVPIQSRRRTSRQRIAQPFITRIAIDRPLTAIIDQLDAQIEQDPRRLPVGRRIVFPIVRFAVEALVAAGTVPCVAAVECRFERFHVRG